MAETLQPTKTVHTVAQFLDWQRNGTLDLSPIFQRRHVWKAPAKSLLIDSIVRGYSLPIILLRQVQDMENLSMKMEVVDGQQRLRTILAYVQPECLGNFDETTDHFTVRRMHNPDLAKKSFAGLSEEDKQKILGYELSTHVFPATTGDALVFRMFARLNSTGLSLNHQEVRNSEYHGAFKSLVYDLSFSCFDLWVKWGLFSNSIISRMGEAEAVSEYLITMMDGIGAKKQPSIGKVYGKYDEEFPKQKILKKRFENTINAIDARLGDILCESAFRRPARFYSLFAATYHHMYGLRSPLRSKRARPLPRQFTQLVNRLSDRIEQKDLPEKVQNAMDKSTTDRIRRMERHRFLMRTLRLEPAS